MPFITVQVRALKLKLPRQWFYADSMGWFILWIMEQAENLPVNSHNVIRIPNAKAAKALNVSVNTIVRWKQELMLGGIIKKVKGQSLYYIEKTLFFKGKTRKH